jgi:site-specific recombinase XerD
MNDESAGGATSPRSDSPRQLTLFEIVQVEPESDGGPDAPANGGPEGPAIDVAEPDGDPIAAVASMVRPDATPGESGYRPPAATLKAAIEEYKHYLTAMNRSKHTQDSFGLDLKLLLEHLGDCRVEAISERDLRSFISWVRLQRHNSATSVRRKVASLKAFFSYLRKERAIPSDPSLRLIYPEIYPALPEFLEDEQVADLLAAVEEQPSWNALLRMMLETGLKRDEVVALSRSDVNLTSLGGSYLVVRETQQAKRLRSRRLEIGDAVAVLLVEFLAGEPVREHFFDISPRGVNFIVETSGKRARLITRGNKLTPQILRETFAVRQMRAMVSREDVLRASGHTEESLQTVIEANDLRLLRMLGLQEEAESAKKYRKLVRGWTAPTLT